MAEAASLETRVRLEIYRSLIEDGRAPTVAEAAATLEVSEPDVDASYRSLADGHAVVLRPGTLDVWMAPPLSAVPTSFRVEVDGDGWWGNCVWDAAGVLAMLGRPGDVRTTCPDCGEPLSLQVDGERVTGDGVGHFAVPAARWWEDIGFT
ncbi:MAG TPA: organomercurial lyase [Actinomycetota bacterium]|nr:organomercurial lyase [Actinomycetota bacterium]